MKTNRGTSGQTDTTDCSTMPSSAVGNKPQAYDVDYRGGRNRAKAAARIDVKKRFLRFFSFLWRFTFFDVFLFCKRFFIFKKCWQSSARQGDYQEALLNNSNEIDLWFFCCTSNEIPPYKLLLTYYVWRIEWCPWRPFLAHQAWRWTTLKKR